MEDIEEIFSDCRIEVLEQDREAPGVFLRARKPKHFKEKDLSKIALFSMATEKRELEIDDHHYQNYIRNVQRMDNIQRISKRFYKKLMHLLSKIYLLL